MRPSSFSFSSPLTIADALRLRATYSDDATYFAGGTELIVGLKERVLPYTHLINLKHIVGLQDITLTDSFLEIGPLVTHQQLADSNLIKTHFSSYAQLSNNIANIRVRSTGTLAGNIAFAEPNADPPALLAALDAQIELISTSAQRVIPIRDFYLGPYTTARDDGELITRILIPRRSSVRSIYEKFTFLHRPSAGVAVVYDTDPNGNGHIDLWAGSLTGKPERLTNCSTELNSTLAGGRRISTASTLTAARADLDQLEIIEGSYGATTYRKGLTITLIERCLNTLLSEN